MNQNLELIDLNFPVLDSKMKILSNFEFILFYAYFTLLFVFPLEKVFNYN